MQVWTLLSGSGVRKPSLMRSVLFILSTCLWVPKHSRAFMSCITCVTFIFAPPWRGPFKAPMAAAIAEYVSVPEDDNTRVLSSTEWAMVLGGSDGVTFEQIKSEIDERNEK